jgi:hypothetical protein
VPFDRGERFADPRAFESRMGVIRSSRIAVQTLQVGANFRGVLITEVAILFRGIVDDTLQFRRQAGIQAQGRHGIAVEYTIENNSRALPRKWQLPVAIS